MWYDLDMPSLTAKQIDGHTYYYARYCQRVDGKPKIVRQVYLGKIEDLVASTGQAQIPPQPLETQVASCGDIAAGGDLGFEGLRGNLRLPCGGYEVLDLAEIDLTDDLGLAVHALAVAGVVVGMAVDLFGGEAWHI